MALKNLEQPVQTLQIAIPATAGNLETSCDCAEFHPLEIQDQDSQKPNLKSPSSWAVEYCCFPAER